MLDMPPGMFTV